MCELSFLPLRPGALEEAEVTEFIEQGIINGAGEVRKAKKSEEKIPPPPPRRKTIMICRTHVVFPVCVALVYIYVLRASKRETFPNTLQWRMF